MHQPFELKYVLVNIEMDLVAPFYLWCSLHVIANFWRNSDSLDKRHFGSCCLEFFFRLWFQFSVSSSIFKAGKICLNPSFCPLCFFSHVYTSHLHIHFVLSLFSLYSHVKLFKMLMQKMKHIFVLTKLSRIVILNEYFLSGNVFDRSEYFNRNNCLAKK